jgi:outer membrane biosynthesis protein TonB
MGINLGPVKLVKDINGHPNIIGDGINVAQRIMSFARPGQIVVSRSYYDVVSNLASEYAKLFHYEGSRTDKHVREHEIYVVGHHEGALQKAKDGMKDRAIATSPNTRKASSGAAPGTQTVTLSIPAFVQDKKKLTVVAASLLVIVIVLAVLVMMKKPAAPAPEVATTTAPAAEAKKAPAPAEPAKAEPAKVAEAPKTEPAKPGEPPKAGEAAKTPESKVLAPAPSPSQVPAPAPASDGKEAAKKDGEKPAPPKAAEAAKADAKGEPGKAGGVLSATVFLDVKPWGEVYVNGKSQGVSPPKKFIKLDPGKYKIEFRNTTFPPKTENVEVKAREEITLRHRFQ